MILDQIPSNSRSLNSSTIRTSPPQQDNNPQTSQIRVPQRSEENLSDLSENENIVYDTFFEEGPDASSDNEMDTSITDQYRDNNPLGNQRDKVKDYEEILQDSPLNSHTQNNLDEVAFPKLTNIAIPAAPENIEDLIQNITELSKKVTQTRKTTHKRGISYAQGPQVSSKMSAQKNKKFVHQSSLLIDSPLDLDSLYTSHSERVGTRKFSRLDQKHLTQMYAELKNTKSRLSMSIKEFGASKAREFTTQVGTNKGKKKNMKTFRVYFFNSKLYLDIPIDTSLTVGEVIRQIMDYYLQDKTVNHSLLKYFKDVEAYELRMLDDEDADYMDDEDAHLPDLSLPPLEKNRVFASLGLEKGVAFVENADYKPPLEPSDKVAGQNTLKFMQDIVNQKKKFIVTVYGTEEQFKEPFKTKFILEPQKTLKDLYPVLTVKVKTISRRYYKFRLYKKNRAQYEDKDDDDEDDDEILDDHMPLTAVKTQIPGSLELEVIRKKFLDEPPQDPLYLKSSLFGDIDAELLEMSYVKESESHGMISYNEVMASQYEEFEVSKLKEKGKSVRRILGIDAVKLYNLFRKKDQDIKLAGVFSTLFYTKIAPKNPERPLSEVLEAKLLNGNKLTIQFKNDLKGKIVIYEASDLKTANKIVSKIQYLKNLEKRRKQLKGVFSGGYEP